MSAFVKTTQTQLATRFTGSVHIIGAGLLGASIGLALSAKNIAVTLEDISPTAALIAADYGAGEVRTSKHQQPQVVIVAVPPDQTAKVIADALQQYPQAIVTDVASVKLAPLKQLEADGIDLERYVGSHPMAGRERGGATQARADLFVARPWVICRDAQTPAYALTLIEAIALEVGAVPVEWDPQEHDEAVATVSHLPQVAASLLAAQLNKTKQQHLELAAGGLRDTTRIAASDPQLWVQILSANSATVSKLLENYANSLLDFAKALRNPDITGARSAIAEHMAAGNMGVARIPGKHGSANQFARLNVIIDDRPGQLAKLFTDLEDLGINMEDMRLEHSPGAQIGFLEISVLPETAERAAQELQNRDWRLV